MQTKAKNILFVYGGLPIGGIETLLVRISKYLKKQDVSVSVLLLTRIADVGLINEINKHANVIYLDQVKHPMSPCFRNKNATLNLMVPFSKKRLYRYLGESFDHIHAPDTTSLVCSKVLLNYYPGAKLTCGVYHDLEYEYKKIQHCWFGAQLHKLFSLVPPENVILVYDHSEAVLNNIYGIDYSSSLVMPLGIDLDSYGMRPVLTKSKRIISVGRLVPFKSYNTYTIKAVKKLRESGIDLVYDIYGTGECENELIKLIHELDLDQYVTLKGNLNYSDFKVVMNNAIAFVGSGTAILEASACGVPSIVGIEDDQEGLTYGFLHQTEGFAYHSAGLNYGITTIYERLNYLALCSFDEYQHECQLARKRSYDFSIEKTVSDLIGAWGRFKPDYAPIGWMKVITIIGSLLFNVFVNQKLMRNAYFGRHSSGI